MVSLNSIMRLTAERYPDENESRCCTFTDPSDGIKHYGFLDLWVVKIALDMNRSGRLLPMEVVTKYAGPVSTVWYDYWPGIPESEYVPIKVTSDALWPDDGAPASLPPPLVAALQYSGYVLRNVNGVIVLVELEDDDVRHLGPPESSLPGGIVLDCDADEYGQDVGLDPLDPLWWLSNGLGSDGEPLAKRRRTDDVPAAPTDSDSDE